MKQLPERIGKFKITGVIGRGGMGDVYKGVQESVNRVVAIKVLPEEYARNEEFLRRFEAEASAVSKLNHHNIVGLYDYGHEEGQRYMAMPYVEGMNLAERLNKEKRFKPETAVEFARQIGRALKYAHERDILHRDIKPQNILLDNANRIFVTDFGIAKIYEQTSVTRTGVVVGTPEYMSPEQAEGIELNPQTDIYSLGIVLYEMLTGNPPFTGDNPLSIAYKHVNVPPPPLLDKAPGIPKRLELVTLKALKKDRAARYRTADEFLQDLDRVFETDPDPETRGMKKITGLQQRPLFDQEQRIVDRRSSDRRREPRRGYFRRDLDDRKPGRGIIRGFLLLLGIGLLFAGTWWLLRAGEDGGRAGERSITLDGTAYERVVGDGFPELAIDNDPLTSWTGEGHLPSFGFRYRRVLNINRIDIVSGRLSPADAFGRFGRPKRIRFDWNDKGSFEAELEDTRERQVLALPATVKAARARITVSEVYPGTESPAPAVAEVRLWFSPAP